MKFPYIYLKENSVYMNIPISIQKESSSGGHLHSKLPGLSYLVGAHFTNEAATDGTKGNCGVVSNPHFQHNTEPSIKPFNISKNKKKSYPFGYSYNATTFPLNDNT